MTAAAQGLWLLTIVLLASMCRRAAPELQPSPTAGIDLATLEVVAPADFTWRGMTFAHEGYDGIRGYGGEATRASMDSLARLSVDALAIVPYTFMRDAHRPAALPIPDRKGGETDDAVIAAIAQTHRKGWRVLLKPQIWLRDGWPGSIDFDTAEDWDAFHEYYHTWMMHYARLAAAHEVEALCIGTELTQATLRHPEFWRKLITDVRAVYPGIVTYAANWGEEFEGITFWSELDALGLNGYYPLSPKPDPTDAELLEGAQAWMRMADASAATADKPLWLTEIGYRSVTQAWQNPHAGVDGRASDTLAQARCYAALFQAAAESEHLEGIFIWKWPSYLGYGIGDNVHPVWGGDAAREFAPSAPVSADLVRRFYGNSELTE